ncbi:MAG: hypothetical protein IKZ07_05210, partial [Akkermansia sp.]|nr:hypothetical protein [Akkermansia sp.]
MLLMLQNLPQQVNSELTNDTGICPWGGSAGIAAHVSQRFSERIAKQQKSGQRKWKVDFFTSKTYAGVAQKKTPSMGTVH